MSSKSVVCVRDLQCGKGPHSLSLLDRLPNIRTISRTLCLNSLLYYSSLVVIG